MDYLNELKKFISILVRSQKFHLLCISSAPGWAKTHTTRQFLGELDVEYHMLGAYSTPLALYNHLSEFPNDISVIDDTAGLFYSAQALSILNAATWPGVSKSGKRVVTWASTSEKVSVPSFEFYGKIIVLTNFLPIPRKPKPLLIVRCNTIFACLGKLFPTCYFQLQSLDTSLTLIAQYKSPSFLVRWRGSTKNLEKSVQSVCAPSKSESRLPKLILSPGKSF